MNLTVLSGLVNKAAFSSSRGDIVDISDPFVYLNYEVYMS